MSNKYRNSFKERRSVMAIILLMVMMMQMGIKTFHQHHRAESARIVCSDCDHHKVHQGHVASWDGTSDNCTLCQLLTTPFTECPAVRLIVPADVHADKYFSSDYIFVNHLRGTHFLRGPPCFLL